MKIFDRSAFRSSRRRWIIVIAALALLAPAGVATAAVTGGGWRFTGYHQSRWGGSPWARRSLPPVVAPQSPAASSPSTAPTSPAATPTSSSPASGTGKIWQPRPGTTWQWQIVEKVAQPFHDITAYDVDLTDAVPQETTVQVSGIGSSRWPKGQNAGIVDRLHAAGKIAICYVATGAWESYEPDASLFPGAGGAPAGQAQSVIGKDSGWSGEHWLDIRASQRDRFAPIIWARFDLAKSIGCDGIHPDQNNVAPNNPGGAVTLADERSWYLEVARQAHARGLSIGMANGLEVLDAEMVSTFDWALNEECFYYDECGLLDPFVKAGKAVFQIEYSEDWAGKGQPSDPATQAKSGPVCSKAKGRSFSTLIRHRAPDSLFVAC